MKAILFNLAYILAVIAVPMKLRSNLMTNRLSFQYYLYSSEQKNDSFSEIFSAPDREKYSSDSEILVDFEELTKESAENAFKSKRDLSDMYVIKTHLILVQSLTLTDFVGM